jgi:catechol 2,3-dioxygenase-like lactoylglutathione lyase family enzyme
MGVPMMALTKEPTMSDPTTIILYVRDALVSGRFYADLFGREPVEAHPNFAMLVMAPGVMLGLWAKHDVQPEASGRAASCELAMTVANQQAVLEMHEDWMRRGIDIIQVPTQMDFGFTFTGGDPDGHRLRVMALG